MILHAARLVWPLRLLHPYNICKPAAASLTAASKQIEPGGFTATHATNKKMGAYLSAPITLKESEDGATSRLRHGASSMQGWRQHGGRAHCWNGGRRDVVWRV